MKKVGIVILFLIVAANVFSQRSDSVYVLPNGDYALAILPGDTLKERDRASQTLRDLRNGAVIIRLKASQKNAEAYRKAGQIEIAERIENDRKKQNEKIFWAFTEQFLFSKVLFIYASETDSFLRGKKGLFLNEKLEHDSTIAFNDSNFVFCEYGSVESFSKFSDYEHPSPERSVDMSGRGYSKSTLDSITLKTSTSPTTTSGLFFSDKNLKQLQRPFPFVISVYMENYTAPVKTLNADMFRAYNRLVVNRDFKEKVKAEKRKAKAAHKKVPTYNPFK